MGKIAMQLPAESKATLRRLTIARILALDPDARAAEERALFDCLASIPHFREASTILLYASAFPEEIDTKVYIASALMQHQKRLILPRMERSTRTLSLHEIRLMEDDLRAGPLGILEPRKSAPRVEPTEIDWVLVPGLAFDDHGRRLGRGAGYYDRLLPTLRADAFKVAMILNAQWVDEVPVEPHDILLDAVFSHDRSSQPSKPAA